MKMIRALAASLGAAIAFALAVLMLCSPEPSTIPEGGSTAMPVPAKAIDSIVVTHWADHPIQECYLFSFAQLTFSEANWCWEETPTWIVKNLLDAQAVDDFQTGPGLRIPTWNKEYANYNIFDGGGWTMTVTYNDGEVQVVHAVNIYESHEFPPRYVEVRDALNAMSSKQVLWGGDTRPR